MSKTTHHDPAPMLDAIDATLRLADRAAQPWHDPEFLAWEWGQVTDEGPDPAHLGEFVVTSHSPGPQHWLQGPDAVAAEIELSDTVDAAPMIEVFGDHPCGCDGAHPVICQGMRQRADFYPPPEHTTYGPLLLGPEPGRVLADPNDHSPCYAIGDTDARDTCDVQVVPSAYGFEWRNCRTHAWTSSVSTA